ncbi:hypothetical protein ACQEVF_56685 [Nonomuraea polychroma]|uniref:hypothetical protein n=1 Tax=Nonomuraea polychroma TaxID=46176 RepID=UPI003D932321
MKTYIFEASQPGHVTDPTGPMRNWGKFLVGVPDVEWERRSHVPGNDSGIPLLTQLGWGRQHVWVLDLQTGEGAFFRPGGHAPSDLNKHKIWVCPMFEPFLVWLYKQDLSNLDKLPTYVELEARFAFAGYRRPGAEHQRGGDHIP